MTDTRPPRLLFDPNLRVVFAITLMAMLGVASVTPAFPEVSAALGIRPQAVGLLVSAFTVPGVLLTPFLGILADRYGRKITLVPSLLVFGLAGAACGFARDFELLVALRFVQGMGAAALGAINVTLIGDLFEGPRRATAYGYNAGVLSIGTAVYPAVGGALTMVAWYAPFFLPILAVPVTLLVLTVLDNPEPRAAVALNTYLRNALRLVRRRRTIVMFTTSVLIFVLIYGAYLTYLPFVLEESFGATPLGTGGVFAAASLATAVASFLLGRLAQRFGEMRLIVVGFLLYVVAFALVPLAPHVWLLLVLVMVIGFANGLTIPSVLTVVADAAPDEYRAIVMSVNGTMLRLGQTVGPLFAGLAFAVSGFRGAFWASAAVALVTLGVLAAARD